MVVEGNGKRLAIECDGDRWHYDKVEDDLARQALLERLGWRFVRIRGSVFYRDKDISRKNAMSPVFAQLQLMGIFPEADNNSNGIADEKDNNHSLDCLKRRSAEILHEWENVNPTSNPEQNMTTKVESNSSTNKVIHPALTEQKVSRISTDLFDSIPSLFDTKPTVNFEIGQIVVHNKFGKGKITAFKDSNQQILIDFEVGGSKWLSMAFATPNLS